MDFLVLDVTKAAARDVAFTIKENTGRPVRCVVFKDAEVDNVFKSGYIMRIIFDKNWGSRKVDGAGDLQVDTQDRKSVV